MEQENKFLRPEEERGEEIKKHLRIMALGIIQTTESLPKKNTSSA